MHRPDLHTADLERLATWPAAEAVARLAAVTEALPTCGDPGALADLARALPVTVAALAPEVCLALLPAIAVYSWLVTPAGIAGLCDAA